MPDPATPEQPAAASQVPTAEDVLKSLEQSETWSSAQIGNTAVTDGDVERQRLYAHLQGLQRHYRHKSQWSYFLMAMMFGMLAFQSFLLWQVGSGAWTFIEHGAWLLPGLLVQNLAQIAGLCVIVVQALFKDVV